MYVFMKTILVTGSCSGDDKVKILNSFGIETSEITDSGLKKYTIANGDKLIVYTDLNRESFDKQILKDIFDKGVDHICMLESLSPRAETIVEDAKHLTTFVKTFISEGKLDIISYNIITYEKKIEVLRNGFLHYDVVFKYLHITTDHEKNDFVNNHCYNFCEPNKEDYQKFINKMGFTQALSSGETINSELKNHQNQSQENEKINQILRPKAQINKTPEIDKKKTNNPVIDKNEGNTNVDTFKSNDNEYNTEIKNCDDHKQTNISKSKNSFIKKAFIACICAIVLTAIIAAIIYVAIPSLFSVGAIAIAGLTSLALTSAITGIVGKEK